MIKLDCGAFAVLALFLLVGCSTGSPAPPNEGGAPNDGGEGGGSALDAGGGGKCDNGWFATCQSEADCWGAGFVCALETSNTAAPKHCTTKCSADRDCTGYDSCSTYSATNHSCVLQTGVCLYW